MPEDPDRPHDTDPLADTAAPDHGDGRATTTQRRSVRAGDTLGRYELIADVGEGGMATVYRARDKELRRDVAVKVLFPHLAKRDEVVHRFHREARAAAGLEHPNILRVYDVGGAESDDPPYIVMELVRGRSLLGVLEKRGPILAEVTACIGVLLADALAVAHKAGIIHRDIKPANILIDDKGRVLVADFGVARLETEDSLVTKTGALLGTPAYMSPEQASGDTATARSDVYSLGATLYQIATGHLPYTGSPAKVLAAIAQGQLVPAVRKRPAVGIDLSRLIDRMMASDPDGRPTGAASVATDLRAIVAASGLGEPAEELAAYFTDADAYTKSRIPAIVQRLVAAGNAAIEATKLPRAMALADRASALAPDDAGVKALIDRITEGDRASRRRRVVALVGIGLVVAGGATFGAMQLVGGSHAVVASDAAAGAVATDAEANDTNALVAQVLTADARTDVVRVDAGVERDAGVSVRHRDAAVAVPRTDAAIVVPIDAAGMSALPPDAGVAAQGFVVVKADSWCQVTIDEVERGRRGPQPLAVTPGAHTVACAQPGVGRSFSKQVDVKPGETVVVEGSLLATVKVTLDVDATIGGTPYRKGQVVPLKASRYEVVVGGQKTWITFQTPCHVRTSPDLGCF